MIELVEKSVGMETTHAFLSFSINLIAFLLLEFLKRLYNAKTKQTKISDGINNSVRTVYEVRTGKSISLSLPGLPPTLLSKIKLKQK